MLPATFRLLFLNIALNHSSATNLPGARGIRATMPLQPGQTLLLLLAQTCLSAGSRPRLEDSPPWIVEHPSDLIVSKGEPATLNCRAEGRPVPAVEWYKDGEHVETDRDDPRSHRMLLPSGALFFLRIVHGRRTKPDEGVYTCVARNYLGEAVSRNASLQVATLRDDFRQAPGDVVVAVGEPAVMECVPPRGHPEPSVSWKRNNVRISDKDGRISMQAGKLLISHTRKSDAGMYVCVGSNMVGERDSDPAELVVFERPVFIRRPVNQIALAEETVDFLCEVHGDPAPTVRWRREEDELPRGRFEIRSDSTLRVLKVRQEDEGTYTCATENSVGRTEASATLQVHVPPKIVHPPQDQISAQGHAVTFHCGTKGNPPPAVFWQKEGTQMLLFPGQPPSQAGRYSVSMSGELTITDVHREDAGYYLCQAISVAGSTISKALLQVDTGPWDLVPPIIRQGPANQTLVPGSSARLQCQAVGTPPPGIRWEKDGRDLPSDGARVKLMENGTLHIGTLQETDSGTYTCVASSSAGETSWSGAVTVRAMGMPAFPPLSQALQLPGPPQKPVATDVSQNSVTLTWQPNQHEGGAAVTSYIIEAFSQSVGSTWQTVADQVKQEKHTTLGLYPNTVYLFIVRAVNSYGLSDPSPISEPVRTQAGGPGGAAVDHRRVQEDLAEVTVHLHPPEFLSHSSVRMSWTVKHEPDYIEGYRLLYRPVGGAWLAQDVKAGPDSTAILSELRSGMEYELKIRPYFREFQGSDSELTVVSIPKEVLCGPPQAVSAVQLGNSSTVRVSWEPPVAVTLAEPVLEYRVWCVWGNTSGAEQQVNQSAAGHQHWTLLDGLEPELQYRVQVLAMTRDGAGAPSHPIFIRLGATVKNPPLPGLKDESVGLSEQISGVVRQPAFIAGLGAASWLVLMCFSAWIYCRHRRSKELGHYVASFAYTPAVGLSHSDGSGLVSGRPCMVGSNMGTHPWLADAWPSASFTAAGKDTVNCCSGRHDSSERYYNTTGIPSVLNQSDTCSQASNEGPIYSTIAPIDEDLSSPCSRDPEPGLSELELRDPDRSAAQYARLQYPRMDHASAGVQGSPGSQGSVGTCPWSEVLTLPRLSSREQWLHERQQHSSEDDGDWCPPLPERMYLMEGVESSATLPLRGEQVCRVSTYGRQSTHGIAPAVHDELQSNPQLLQPDLLPSPNLLTKLECHNGSPARAAGHWRDFKKDVLFTDNSEHFTGPFDHSTPSHPRPKKRSLRERPRRREIVQSGDLPPPPEPPPVEESLKQLMKRLESSNYTPPDRRHTSAVGQAGSRGGAVDVQPIQHGWVTAVFRSSRPSRCFPAGGPSPLSYTARRAKEVWRTRHSSCVGVNNVM
ncbi:roundabout homolog 3 isoform X2 [Electrophorus electricus]|uniref:roundabout homolog 3 isoform X2 n=1 Tax=Electrophorus electricus TaxID=8005 RepID=UPI0015D01FC3|nr:roundabout homolog 3 isoform X2 [Electrophorus electricus]